MLSCGNKITAFKTEFCKIGVAICYDMRFPELIHKMTMEGSKIIIIPAAFNMTTGPAHWHSIIRARAIDNQIYLIAASPARNTKNEYVVIFLINIVLFDFSGFTCNLFSIVHLV